MLIRGIRPVIPPKSNRKVPPVCDFRAYKDRNRIERLFNSSIPFITLTMYFSPQVDIGVVLDTWRLCGATRGIFLENLFG
jgi:hypothetical protein